MHDLVKQATTEISVSFLRHVQTFNQSIGIGLQNDFFFKRILDWFYYFEYSLSCYHILTFLLINIIFYLIINVDRNELVHSLMYIYLVYG